MSDSTRTGGVPQAAFTGPADGDTAAEFRAHLRGWLDATVELDADRVADILLATYEALANCAEHAYDDDEPTDGAVMTLDVSHCAAEETVQIRVADRGHWSKTRRTVANATRGRGLMLMRGLTDECVVQSRSGGTTALLRFEHCPGRDGDAARAC